jgi:hypothetical protein
MQDLVNNQKTIPYSPYIRKQGFERQESSNGSTSQSFLFSNETWFQFHLIDLLQIGIKIPKPYEVQTYLFKFPDLNPILKDVCKAAIEEFAQDSILSLELYVDPETNDEYLTLFVRQKQYSEDIMDRIEKVQDRIRHYLADKNGSLLITTDFQHPMGV